ncbi:MAG: type II toxin-antitoxin system VapC family toxin [Acidobacteria bacterium]|nr:type II toxin-antitoxin system VapC family toxin [Acidobacteriota bacterium]
MTPPTFVLDAWALLAFLQGEEPAAARVAFLLRAHADSQAELFVSVINLGEVFYRLGRTVGVSAAERVMEDIREMGLNVLPADEATVFHAARLKALHRISYADAFAAAAAESRGGTLVTGDAELKAVDWPFPLEFLSRER